MHLRVIFMRPMTEIHPEGIDACEKQRLQHFRCCACRSDGSDDFCATITMHISTGPMGRPYVIGIAPMFFDASGCRPYDEAVTPCLLRRRRA